MTRHVRWMVWLGVTVAAPVAGLVLMLYNYENESHPALHLVVFVLLFIVPVVSAIFLTSAWANLYWNSDRYRAKEISRRGGPPSTRADYQAGYDRAGALLNGLASGGPHPSMTSYTVALEPGEVAVFQIRAHYSRYYGQTVHYHQGGGFAFGPPVFVAAAVTGNMIANRSAKKRAEQQAAEQWREQQYAPVLVTDRRLLINVSGQWLWFYYQAISAIHPAVDRFELVLEFSDTSPLRLEGPDVASVAVWVLGQRFDDQVLDNHPDLQNLRTAAKSLPAGDREG